MGALDRIFRRRQEQQRPLESYVRGLWRGGEQGVWYDPSDMSTLFQDAAGTTPVYMPGQGQVDPPVGLLLDKRLGLVRGPDMVTNGDFATAAGWLNTSGSDWTFGTGAAVRTTTASANGFQTSIPAHVAGRYYLVSFEITAVTNAGVGISAYLGAASTPPVTSPGKYSFFVLSDGTSPNLLRFYPRGSSNFFAGSIDNVSIQAIPGNHAYQPTTTSRPTLSARYNALLASEKFDDAYWGFTSNYAVEKTGDVQDPSGGSNAWKITSTTGSAALNKVVGAGFKNPVYTVILRAGSRNPDILVRNATTTTNLVGGSTSSPSTSGTYGKFTNADLGGGWRKLTIEITSGVATSDALIVYLGSTGSVATGQYFYAYRAEFREGNDGVGLPEYQRVVDANTYDTVGFPPYLKFDGVDDWLQTAAVDFSGTDKITLACSARKQADTSVGELLGFSATPNLSAGGFGVLAPPSATPRLEVSVCGTTNGYVHVHSAAPETGVYVARLNLAVAGVADGKVSVRKNGTAVSPLQSGSGAGTGNFGNYPLYIGRRGGSSLPFNGRLYGLIICGAATPDATIAKVERYLNQKSRIY